METDDNVVKLHRPNEGSDDTLDEQPRETADRVAEICAQIERHVSRARASLDVAFEEWLRIIPLVRELKEYIGGEAFTAKARELHVGPNYANCIVRYGCADKIPEIRRHFDEQAKGAWLEGEPFEYPSLRQIIAFCKPEPETPPAPRPTVKELRGELEQARRESTKLHKQAVVLREETNEAWATADEAKVTLTASAARIAALESQVTALQARVKELLLRLGEPPDDDPDGEPVPPPPPVEDTPDEPAETQEVAAVPQDDRDVQTRRVNFFYALSGKDVPDKTRQLLAWASAWVADDVLRAELVFAPGTPHQILTRIAVIHNAWDHNHRGALDALLSDDALDPEIVQVVEQQWDLYPRYAGHIKGKGRAYRAMFFLFLSIWGGYDEARDPEALARLVRLLNEKPWSWWSSRRGGTAPHNILSDANWRDFHAMLNGPKND